jgi:hypothetical protein
VLAANAALLLAYVAAGRLGLENGARGRLRDAAVPACQHGDGHRAHRAPLTRQGAGGISTNSRNQRHRWHQVGDLLLIGVVSRRREVGTIARLGGSEFARPVPAAEFEALAAQTRRVTLR